MQNGIHLGIKEIFEEIKLSDVLILDKSINSNFTKYSISTNVVSDDFSLIRESIENEITYNFKNT